MWSAPWATLRRSCSVGNPAGITRVHGHPQSVEIGGHKTYLYPIFHPAAALYTPSMLTTLKEDVLRLPELMSHAVPEAEQAAAQAEAKPHTAAAQGMRPDTPPPGGPAKPVSADEPASADEPSRAASADERAFAAQSGPGSDAAGGEAARDRYSEQLGLF